MTRNHLVPRAIAASAIVVAIACSFDDAYRQIPVAPTPPVCAVGAIQCDVNVLQVCATSSDGTAQWTTKTDCAAGGLVCAATLDACAVCGPGLTECGGPDGSRVDTCRSDGSGYDPGSTCEGTGLACRAGACTDLCGQAATTKSNVGCEYWGAQLDNADISASLNASAQQYAIVVSNPQPDVEADVTVTEDDAEVGQPADVRIVAQTTVAPLDLAVLLLGPRWVDGTTDTLGDGQTNSALSRHAYKITSDVPIIAFQFNPLDNVNVFSNDASLLKPVEAMGVEPEFVVAGWPQTIAISSDPNTNFGLQLRNYVTVIGTRADTQITVNTAAHIVAGGSISDVPAGGSATYTLQPYEVLNLETGDFHADFTGSIVDANEPVIVFSGSEASDAPHWDTIAERSCCADHLEQQLDPVRTAGRHFAVARMPNRSRAVIAAGATTIGLFNEPEFMRFVAATTGTTHVETSLPAPDDAFDLDGIGAFREVTYTQDFAAEGNAPLHVIDVQASQEAAGIPTGLPGGDPSLVVVPPVEQWRSEYVFLTPDKYVFDFVTVIAPTGTALLFDDAPFDAGACEQGSIADVPDPLAPTAPVGGYDIWRCQLSFPVIDQTQPAGMQVSNGRQNDGVHVLRAAQPVGLIVYGFDSYVSYAYPAGTQLADLTVGPE